MRCVQEGETQDDTGNTGSEHGDMHRLGKGQDTRDYYTMNNRKRGRTWQQLSLGVELGSGILGGCVGVMIVGAMTWN